MTRHDDISAGELHGRIRRGAIRLGGNRRLGIYGTLGCPSGKRMKRENRVFFCSEREAILSGYRPCARCMKRKYQKWKDETL